MEVLVMREHSGFGGTRGMLASGTQDCGFAPGRSRWDFFRRKNPQHAFLQKGSKAICPMSQICGMSKNPTITVKVAGYGLNYRTFLAHFRSSLTEDYDVA
jgi:hypothetical protein